MNGENATHKNIWIKAFLVWGIVCLGIFALGIAHASGIFYKSTEYPRGGDKISFDTVEQLCNILPEGNLLLKFPLEGLREVNVYGIGKQNETDALEYEQFFSVHIQAYDQSGNIIQFVCSIDDPKSSKPPTEWDLGFYEKDTTKELEIEGIKIYYSNIRDTQRAKFYIGSDIYDLVWSGDDRTVFLNMLEEILK